MNTALTWLSTRLQEPSTWAGLALIASNIGGAVSTHDWSSIVASVGGAVATIAAEKGSPTPTK